MTAASNGFRAALAAVLAAAAVALGGCGSDGAGASNTAGATQAAPGAGTSTGATSGQVAITVSSAVPTSGNGAVTGSTVVDSALGAAGSTTRTVVADGTNPTGVFHRFRVDYDSVSGVVLAITHGWGSSSGTFDLGQTGCVRAVTATVTTLCPVGLGVDLANRRLVLSNALLRGAGTFSSLLNGTITFPAP